MTVYIIRRVLQLIPVLLGVSILVFSLMHLTPGNPAQLMAGESAPPDTIEQIEESLGLNDPLPVQYWDYISGVVQGDLGTSMRYNTPVADEV